MGQGDVHPRPCARFRAPQPAFGAFRSFHPPVDEAVEARRHCNPTSPGKSRPPEI
jgi:hypothetical protein